MVVRTCFHLTLQVVVLLLLCDHFAVESSPTAEYYYDSPPTGQEQPPVPENSPDYQVDMLNEETILKPHLSKFRKKMTAWVEEQVLKTMTRLDLLQTDLYMVKNNANHQEESIRSIEYKIGEIKEEFSEVDSRNDDMKDDLDKFVEITTNEAFRIGLILDQQDQLNNQLLNNVTELKKDGEIIKETQKAFRKNFEDANNSINDLDEMIVQNEEANEEAISLLKSETILLNEIVNDTKLKFEKDLASQATISAQLFEGNLEFGVGLEKLAREISELRLENEVLQTQNRKVETQSEAILEENKSIRLSNSKLLSENREIVENYRQSIKKLNESNSNFEQIKEQNSKITAENNKIKSENSQIKERVEQALKENSNLKIENANILSLNKVIQNKVAKSNAVLKNATADITSLNIHVTELDKSSQLLISENHKTDSEITELNTKISEIDDFDSKIEPKVANLEKDLKALQGQSSEIQEAYVDVTDKVSENRRQFNISLNELINSVNVKNGEIVKSVEDFEDVLIQTVGENLRLKNNISNIAKNYTSIKLNNKAIKEELKFVEMKLSKSKTEKIKIESNLRQLQNNFTEIAEENEKFKNKVLLNTKSLHPTTCEEILLGNPGAETGLYTIFENAEDETGFQVKCEFSARSVKQVLFEKSCTLLNARSPENENGVYKVFPSTNNTSSLSVYCQGPWTVFHKRFDGSQNFNQNFSTYETGFGNLDSEHWLGLIPLHELTKVGNHVLRVEMEDFDGNEAYAEYQDFAIGAGPGYVIRIGKYNGTAGNSLSAFTNKRKFSTPDRDQDRWRKKSCAVVRTGAFWWDRCGFANPNSWTYNPDDKGYHMYWYKFHRDYTPLKAMTWMFKSL